MVSFQFFTCSSKFWNKEQLVNNTSIKLITTHLGDDLPEEGRAMTAENLTVLI